MRVVDRSVVKLIALWVLSRYPGKRLYDWIESKLELTINRDKTRVIHLGEEQASLDFLGYPFRWHRGRYGRGSRYLHVGPGCGAQSALERLGQLGRHYLLPHFRRLGLQPLEI